MEEILEILRTHLEKYPKMTPQDCFKLIYQNELGPGHLVRNEKESLELLKKEWDSIEADENEVCGRLVSLDSLDFVDFRNEIVLELDDCFCEVVVICFIF